MADPVHHRLDIRRLLVPRRSVARTPHLEAFLPEIDRIDRKSAPLADTDAIAGWGHKPTARRARDLAAEKGLPYLALEDGFLRSIGLGEAGTPSLSLVADDLGIYYDARGSSRLENLLEQGGWQTPELLARAEAAMARIVETGLGKTNASPRLAADALPESGRPRILLVDQTAGDASIEGGLASDATFATMLATAKREHPDAELIVRRHPVVAARIKQGCIPDDALDGCTLLDANARAADIVARADEVWCVTSLMGFEALMAGKPVRCFGLPFYAGWGATRDEVRCERRTATRSVVEIFAAAYLLYSRYVDPITGRSTDLEATIDRLLHWRALAEQSAGHSAAIGFRPWKRAAVRNALSGPNASIRFHGGVASAERDAALRAGRIVVWAGKENEQVRQDLGRAAVPVWRMEDGFVRSRGLGSDFHLPASIVLDDEGIYFDRHQSSRLETILESHDFTDAERARATALREALVAANISKYNVGHDPGLTVPEGKTMLLVVGQVEDDRSIERGTSGISTNRALLEAARADHPDAHIVYKPHPDVENGNRQGIVEADVIARYADAAAHHADIAACLEAADALATMTSLAGFEALMRGKTVHVYGGPFYAGWGLTDDRLQFDRRTRRLSLDELVAGTLIEYPRYIHPPTGLPCTPEEVVAWLTGDAPAPGHRRWRWMRAIWNSISGARPALY